MSACLIMENYEASQATLAAIAARHGTTAEEVRPILSGAANRAFLLRDELVLRIPRTKRFLPDLVKEAAVIPAARRAGVRTPDVVTFDDTCSSVDVPYMVLVRAPGVDLAQLELPAAETDRVFHQVGREVAKLHRVSLTTAMNLSTVPADDAAEDPRALVGRLLTDGWIDSEAAYWLTGWFDRLSAHVPPDPPRVLVHGDIAPQNLLVSSKAADLTGIVDWGDAQWADPATEFAKIPLASVPAMLDGYRQEASEGFSANTQSWEARVLWLHLTWALARVMDPLPQPGERHWTAPPASRLLGLLRFFASAPPAPWADLT